MSSPSDIPNHPLVQMVDYQGDAFPTGSSYFIKNLCSNFYQTLAFNYNIPGAVTCTAQPDPNCKWLIQYENNDRSRVAFKSAATGRYLAVTSPDHQAAIGLSDQMVFWWVYQGSSPGTYWFSTTQSKDCFLHTWNCQKSEGSRVASFTNRDPKMKSYYNKPYSMFEDWGSGMSWGLDPTPELMQWKEQQKVNPESQQSKQGDEDVKRREQAAAEKDTELERKMEELNRREQVIAAKEKDAETREAGLKEKEQAFEKSYDELKKKEEAVRAAEERVKKTKKGGKADHLAAEEEKDKLQEETKDMKAELEAAKREIDQLKEQLQKAHQQKQTSGSGRQAPNNGYRMQFTIKSPEAKRPAQKLPEAKKIERKVPETKKPGQSLPNGWNSSMVQRFEAGKKAMSTTA